MKRLWSKYADSFVNIDVIHAECAPASVAVAALAIAAALVGASFATETVGLRHVWVPLAFLGAGAISSTVSWLVGVRRRNLFMALQALEFNLYGLPFTAAAAFSKAPAGYAFAAFYAIVLQHYARTLKLTALGALFVTVCPFAFAVAAGADVGELFIIGLADGFFLYTSANTTRHTLQAKRAVRASEVLQQIDSLLVERRKQGTADKRVEMVATFHELKNAIAPARWNVEFLASSDRARDDAERDLIEDALGSLVSATQLVDRFLVLLREDTAHEVDEGFWLDELPTAFAELSAKDAILARHPVLFEEIPSVKAKGPSAYLVLALRNLASNGFEAGATNVRVHGSVSHQAAGVTVLVSDDGPGLPNHVSQHLFEPFNTHGKAGGTGLGIYLAKRLLEAIDGSIALGSTSAAGTVFEITLPLLAAQASSAHADPTEGFADELA